MTRAGRALGFVWGGWAGLAGLCLLAALWQAGHEAWGAFILPAPGAVLTQALALLADPASWGVIARTMARAALGFALASGVAGVAGMAAGYSPAALRLARPLLTVVLGVPPIAWLVVAMIWFGASDGMVLATIVVGVAPLVFAGTAEGVAARDRGLDAMARAFGAGPWTRFWRLTFRQALAHLFPALTLGLASAVKVAVMIEVLTSTGGIGGALAQARQYMDMTLALAWTLIAVGGIVALEYGVLHPLRAEAEAWRHAARPWGVRR